jgi:hypothetical protein
MLGGQFAVVGPIWFALLLFAVWHFWRNPAPKPYESHDPSAIRLLIAATLVPWLVFGGFSFITKIQPNWPVLALLPGTVLLAALAMRLFAGDAGLSVRGGRGWLAAALALGFVTVLVAHHTALLYPWLKPLADREPPWNETPIAKYDPAARLRGWAQLGHAVAAVRAAAQDAGHDPFIVADDYQVASQIAFYCPGQPAVYCLQSVLGDRLCQYDLWDNPIDDPEPFLGRPCIYVGVLKPELIGKTESGHVTLRGARRVDTVTHEVRGLAVQIWPISYVEEFAGIAPELERRQNRY